MGAFKEYYQSDLHRYGDGINFWNKRFHYYFRKIQTTHNVIMKSIYCLRLKGIKEKRGIEISNATQIGKGLYLGHPYNITINEKAVIGENCNIHKGVVIGAENRGLRKGFPIIGNCVWIGINAAIVGKVTVGDHVLIAPNSFVNCDIPSDSVVYGNPCVIKHKDDAVAEYINNIC